MPEVELAAIGRCWNGIYLSLSNVRSRYEDLKAQNPNITIIVEELSPKLKEKFLDMIELILTEHRVLNGKAMHTKYDFMEWQYGKCMEYFLKNDILGTIVTISLGNNIPLDLIDETVYLLASLIDELPAAFLVNENVLIPTGRLLNGLATKTSKYSVVLCDRICNRIIEYPPLFSLLKDEAADSFGCLLAALFDNQNAFRYIVELYIKLLRAEGLDFEDYILSTPRLLESISRKLTDLYENVLVSHWNAESTQSFIAAMKSIDLLVSNFSDAGKGAVASVIKERFVKEHLAESLKSLKLFDGTVVKALSLLSDIYSEVHSIELTLPIGTAFQSHFFSTDMESCESSNLQRLLFSECENQLSMAILELLRSILMNNSRKLLIMFGCPLAETSVLVIQNRERCQSISSFSDLLNLLPDQIGDKNPDNVSLLYKQHLVAAEAQIPCDSSELNFVDLDASPILSSLIVKIFDAFKSLFWLRTPKDNIELSRFILTLFSLSHMEFSQKLLLGKDPLFSLLVIIKDIVDQCSSDSLRPHIERSETLRSVGRFRAALFEHVHKNQQTVQSDMFEPGHLLEQLLADQEAMTVGAVSGNVLVLYNLILRIAATHQVQATRSYLNISYTP